ncbi:hypothetical protein CMI37_06480 [Candidatus Pacearchaeota archaeon]|jgi:hypothetical protein|nr:hypothetical protein [Candidatus Pacearchaeota archaeon]|tara:strand:- start:2296 stop:2511 length:216 start_codon:yes stop_codon:yes gene_type:complete
MENIDPKEVEAFNKKITALQNESNFNLGSEVFIDKGLIKSKVVLVPRADVKTEDSSVTKSENVKKDTAKTK